MATAMRADSSWSSDAPRSHAQADSGLGIGEGESELDHGRNVLAAMLQREGLEQRPVWVCASLMSDDSSWSASS